MNENIDGTSLSGPRGSALLLGLTMLLGLGAWGACGSAKSGAAAEDGAVDTPGDGDGSQDGQSGEDGQGHGRVVSLERPDGGPASGARILESGLIRQDAAEPLEARVRWETLSFEEEPTSHFVTMAPIVVPLGKGVSDAKQDARRGSDVLVVTVRQHEFPFNPGRLRALAGDSGDVLWTSPQEGLNDADTPAAGDIDGDGEVEIVWSGTPSEFFPFVLDHRGQLKYKLAGPQFPPTCHSAFTRDHAFLPQSTALSDMDHDGHAEIVRGRSIVQWDLSAWVSGEMACGFASSFAADVLGDSREELIADFMFFDTLGQPVFRLDDILGDNGVGIPMLADLDGDHAPELIVAGPYYARIISVPAGEILAFRATTSFSPGAVADFDGDGTSEVVLAQTSIRPWKVDGSRLWERPWKASDGCYGRGAVVAFDFDGDGASEIVYQNYCHLFVLDGPTGAVRLQIKTPCRGNRPTPTIADVDGDGAAEIVLAVSGPDDDGTPVGGVRVLESAGKPWPFARGVWNQVSYFRDNVNDDGSIPVVAGKPWLSHNSFRSADARDYPDLLVQPSDEGEATCQGGQLRVRLQVGNQGRATASAGAVVALYATVAPVATVPTGETAQGDASESAGPVPGSSGAERDILLDDLAVPDAIEPHQLSEPLAFEVPLEVLSQALGDGDLLALHATVTASAQDAEYHTKNNDTAWGLAPCELP